jgi:hypothetical protein
MVCFRVSLYHALLADVEYIGLSGASSKRSLSLVGANRSRSRSGSIAYVLAFAGVRVSVLGGLGASSTATVSIPETVGEGLLS